MQSTHTQKKKESFGSHIKTLENEDKHEQAKRCDDDCVDDNDDW